MNHDWKAMRKICTLGIVLCFAAGYGAVAKARLFSQKNNKDAKAAAPATGFAPDKGKFRILLEGHEVGNEEFEISPSGVNWMARGSTTAHTPDGGDYKATAQLTLTPDVTPPHYHRTPQP